MGGEWFVLYLVEEQSMELKEEEFALLHLEVWWCGCVVVCVCGGMWGLFFC